MIATETVSAHRFLSRRSTEFCETPSIRSLSFSSESSKDYERDNKKLVLIPDNESFFQSRPLSSLILSQALKIGTQESHTAAENVHFVRNFIEGKIKRHLYMDLVTGLYHIYVSLETLLEKHAPSHFPDLHFPRELCRTEALREDMEYWHGPGWELRPECRTPSPAVWDYVERMRKVGRLEPLLLLSHAYTRYLGDLSGGKVMARIARRALNLGKGHDGLQFYNFERIKSAKLFKDKYREALDGLVLVPDQVGRLVAEANVSFALNMRMFEELDIKGGIAGSTLKPLDEALSYYFIEVEEQRSGLMRDRSVSSQGNEQEQCPFGFKGGPRPHGPAPLSVSTERNDCNTLLRSGGGRCPWPFIFLHDPATGMRDWQTWCIAGLLACWSYAGIVW